MAEMVKPQDFGALSRDPGAIMNTPTFVIILLICNNHFDENETEIYSLYKWNGEKQ